MTDTASIGRLLFGLGPVVVLAALISAGLIIVLSPWLKTHALARPNARSSHREATPQGGGGAVVVATFAAAWGATTFASTWSNGETSQFLAVTAAAALLAVVGAVDDIRGLAPRPRLILQGVAFGIVIAALPAELRLVAMLPWWVERGLMLLAGIWCVNLTNFMDGIDWMTVAEVVPVTGGIVILGLLGIVLPLPTLIALALLGAMLGFAPFNKPVAKLFLGDVGSLPIGLVLGWLLLQLAGRGELAAALILPLYYVADATLTLLRRMAAGEPISQAHRSHFYQRAIDNGFTVPQIIARVAVVNLALVVLAVATASAPTIVVKTLSLAAGCALVGWLLITFARGKR
jgi:UDP-N-acetylmuramyl pentapeptide phosphotransferase/UDP-N-acetylglucosamine-1-phosphate transferase